MDDYSDCSLVYLMAESVLGPAEPFSYLTNDHLKELKEHVAWCEQHVGKKDEDWDVTVAPWDAAFLFVRAEDAMLFTLSFTGTVLSENR